MLGGFLLQPAFGAVLDSTTSTSTYSSSDYQKALVLLPISILVGTILSFWIKETGEK